VTIQMKGIEQYFHVVLSTMLYKAIPTFKSTNDTQVFDHSNESYFGALLRCSVCFQSIIVHLKF